MLNIAFRLIVGLIITLLTVLFIITITYYLALFLAFICGLFNLQVAAEFFRSFAYGIYNHTRNAISFITGGKL